MSTKTHSSFKKRFLATGTGYKRRCQNRNHMLTKKSAKVKRHARRNVAVANPLLARVRRFLNA